MSDLPAKLKAVDDALKQFKQQTTYQFSLYETKIKLCSTNITTKGQAADQEIQEIASRLQSLTRKFELSQKQYNNDTKTANQEKEKQIQLLKNEIKTLNEAHNKIETELKSEISKQETKLSTFSADINSKIDKLQSNMQEKDKQIIAEKDKQIQILKDEIKTLNDEHKSYQKHINAKLSGFDTKNSESSANLQKLIVAKDEKIAEISAQMKALTEEKKEEPNSAILAEINALKQEIVAVKASKSGAVTNEASDLERVKMFFEGLDLGEYVELVVESGFEDMESLYELTNEDLAEMKFKIAHRKKILKAVQDKQAQNS